MVLLTTTPTILRAISLLPTNFLSAASEKRESLPGQTDAPISHTTLIKISRCLPQYTLNTLLRGTRPYYPPPSPKPEPSPEYKALMARLKVEEERKNYQRLLRERDEVTLQAQSPEASVREEVKDDISPSLVLNILLSIVMCAAVAFHLTRYWRSDGVRVLVSLGTAVLVGVAEVVVYNSYLRKVKEGKLREMKKREVKVIIGEFTGEESEAVEAWGEKRQIDITQIWGKGVHGGMRRRVREKWEKEQAGSNN